MQVGLAKRSVGKSKASIVVKHLYQSYIDSLPKKPSVYNVKNTLFTQILKEYNEAIMRLIIEKNFEYKVPFRLGTVRIKACPLKLKLDENGELITRTIPVDWKATKQMWSENPDLYEKRKLIFITNEHFDGNKVFFYWNKKTSNTKNLYYRSFVPSRSNKRKLAEVIKDPNIKIKYYE